MERVSYLDNLRAIAMLLGVYLHAAFAYAQPAQSFWLATDPAASVAVDASIWFLHLFRMGLFFLLSGYFAKLVIERRGVKQFLWNRCLRIVGPFLLFYPFLLVAMTVVLVFAMSYVNEPKGLLGVISAAVKDAAGDQKREPAGTMHLWFLYYLAAFSIMAAVLVQCKWLQVAALFRRPFALWLLPMVLTPAAYVAGTPMPAAESFIPIWWPFLFYGVFFAAGWQLLGRESFLERCRPYVWLGGLLSLAMFAFYYYLMPVLDLSELMSGKSSQGFWVRCLQACLTAYLSALLTLLALVLGKRYLAKRSAFLSFIADSSYWVYLLHLPIVIFLQTLLIPVSLPVWCKLTLVLVGTMVPCLATYVVFVRYTPLGWLLHGKRAFP